MGLGNYYEDLGQVHMAFGNYDEAGKYMKHSIELENKYLPKKELSSGHVYKLFTTAKDNFAESYRQMKTLIAADDPNKEPMFKKYMLASTEYIFGHDSETKKKGEIVLRSLQATGKYGLVRKASKQTLESRQVNFI